MPLSFRDRGGRLQAFARHNSADSGRQNSFDSGRHNSLDSNSHLSSNGANGTNGTNGHTTEKRTEQPSLIAAPGGGVKQEMIETARYPLTTKPGRYTAPPTREGSNIGLPHPVSSPRASQVPGSPPRPVRPRANSDDRHGGLFSGSQLGEGFLKSGLTTPQNESIDPLDVAGKETASPGRKKSIQPHQSPERKFPDRTLRKSNGASFVLRDDGIMTVVTGGPSRNNSLNLKDGFQNDAVNGATARRKGSDYFETDDLRPMSPKAREVKIRRSYVGRLDPYDEDDPRTSSPTLDAAHWQSHRKEDPRRTTVFHDLDEDLNSSTNEDAQLTPRPKKSTPMPRSSLMESSMPMSNGLSQKPKDKKRRRGSPDYDDRALTSMSYTDLQRQPFDFDPSKVAEQNGSGIDADTLDARLEQARDVGESEQRHFFATMSINEWEESGDWFVDQFTDFMQRMKQARQNKRRIIQGFEYEAATREEAVRLRTEAIDRKLAKMKQDGQRVVEDKEI